MSDTGAELPRAITNGADLERVLGALSTALDAAATTRRALRERIAAAEHGR